MLKNFIRILGGDPNKKAIDKSLQIVDQINVLESQFEALNDEALRAKTGEFRARLANGETLDDLLPEAFATVREASKRTIGLRHYEVQLIGGITLHQGKIAEMRTGEGKTLVATLPLYLNALTGRGAHLITVNDYLARRDARWMGPIYISLGLSVGVLQMAARTENGKKAFLVDLEKRSPHEDQDQLRMTPRREAYTADITYGINSEFGFDYLRDNMTYSLDERVQRGHHYAIIDEVDNVLIDEARTPLIISGPASESTEWYVRMSQIVRQLRPEDYEVSERDNTVTLTEVGEVHVEELLGMALRDPDRPEDITPEQARLLGYLEQALRAQYLFHRNKEYIVQGGKVVIVDEFTGRLMPGRRWSDGLHQAVEAKEGVKVEAENVTYATITIQNYFRMYQKLAGMSGTAVTESEEFHKIYKLDVLPIPTNLEYQALRTDSPLIELDTRDSQGYKFSYFSRRDDLQKRPIFYRRQDFPDIIYRTEEAKFRALCAEIMRYHAMGRPILVGTTSVELSERLSSRLRAEPLRRLAQTLLLRQTWFAHNNREMDGRAIPELEYLNAPLDGLDLGQMRKMGRDLGITLGPEDTDNLEKLLTLLELDSTHQERLTSILKAGIPHQVLNARKHTEESQIIAGAGAFGAVTIATNMAGRGVDIKLGGELAEEIVAAVNRVLRKTGHADPYSMRLEERRQIIKALDPAEYGIYGAEIDFFLQHMDEMGAVRQLGGLHIIGSERHEARRIDNQLRGRAARQGDPGSSRFYLSLQDELMRRFGGQQVDNVMQRMKVDDALPMEFGIVSRLVESSQTRVEGANFDVRKHLLEYDDVLNTQRAHIYAERDQIFVKDDLSADVAEMLRAELRQRVPEALKDPEGPWKLLAWLDQIQPTRNLGNTILPSYTVKCLVDQLENQLSIGQKEPGRQELIQALLEVADQALEAEANHLLNATQHLIEEARTRLETTTQERLEALDMFFEGLSVGGEEGESPKTPRELLDELSGVLRIPIKMSTEDQRLLRDDPARVAAALRPVVRSALANHTVARAVGAIQHRLQEPLEITVASLPVDDWDALANQVETAVEATFRKRQEHLVGERLDGSFNGGQIARDLEAGLGRISGGIDANALAFLLMLITEGTFTAFDKKTHRRVQLRKTRLNYLYMVALQLEDREADEITEAVLAHLENAQGVMRRAWGQVEASRLTASRISELSEATQNRLRETLGEAEFLRLADQTVQTLTAQASSEAAEKIITELGRRALTEIYRQLLLGVLTELWVDYLTQMEALRVSIGLEAYAQRDPLVQYKSRAFEMFKALMDNTRQGVVSRMFTYQPRNLGALQATVSQQEQASESPESEAEAPPEAEAFEGEAEPEAGREADPSAITADERAGRSKRHRKRRR